MPRKRRLPRPGWRRVGCRVAFALGLCALSGFGCQTEGPPPFAPEVQGSGGQVKADAGIAEDDGPLFDGDLTTLPDSSCGATVVSLDFERANLYFLVDASGSMATPIAGSLPQDRYTAVVNAIEFVLRSVGHRVNYGVTTFPGAGETGCEAGAELHSLGPGDASSFASSGSVGPILSGLVFNLQRASRTGGTPIGPTLRVAAEALTRVSGPSYVFLLTDGAPNCNPELTCSRDQCIANIEGWALAPDLRCDDSVNCCELVTGACLDGDASEEAISELATAGIKTFVVGIPGSTVYASLLERLALAGGVPREIDPKYYRVDDAEALTETLLTLGRRAALQCTISLSGLPPDRALVNVLFDARVIPQDTLDGWRWLDDRTLEVVGESCALLEAGQVLEVRVVAGCPVVVR